MKTRAFPISLGILTIFSFMAFVVIAFSPSFGKVSFSLDLISANPHTKYYFLLIPGALSTIFFGLLGRNYFFEKKSKIFTIIFLFGFVIGFAWMLWGFNLSGVFHGLKNLFNCSIVAAIIALFLANLTENPQEES